MIWIFCHAKHDAAAAAAPETPAAARERGVNERGGSIDGLHFPGGICPDCAALLEYAHWKLDKCPFGENKTSCAKCTIHCYESDMRGKIREVMRFSGPRMLLRNPVTSLMHMIEGLKRPRKM